MPSASNRSLTARLRAFSFWRNSFDEIIGKDPGELKAAVSAQFGAASLEGGLPEDAWVDCGEPEEVTRASLRVLASIEQGHRLRGDAEALGRRLAGPGMLFAALPGTKADGMAFAESAVQRGAVAILAAADANAGALSISGYREPPEAAGPGAARRALLRRPARDGGSGHRHQWQDLGCQPFCAKSGRRQASKRQALGTVGIVTSKGETPLEAHHARSGFAA